MDAIGRYELAERIGQKTASVGRRRLGLGARCWGWLALLLLCATAGSAHAGPDLYLDGEALGNHVTDWILRNTDAATRKRATFRVSPLLVDLFAGAPVRFQDHLELEDRLKTWMRRQPDRSITPDAYYARAIGLTGGNVPKAMLLAWNVLRKGWGDVARNDFLHTRALVDITGERDRLVPPKASGLMLPFGGKTKSIRGDNFSAWYHFSGTALHTYLTATSRWLPFLPAHVAEGYTRALVFIEEKVLYNQFVDPLKRRNIDLAGARFGRVLATNLKKYDSAEALAQAGKGPSERGYLYDNPEVYGPKWHLAPGQDPLTYRMPKRESRWGRVR